MISFSPIASLPETTQLTTSSLATALEGAFDATLSSLTTGSNDDDPSQAAAFNGFGIFGRETESGAANAAPNSSSASAWELQATDPVENRATVYEPLSAPATTQTPWSAAPNLLQTAMMARAFDEASRSNAPIYDATGEKIVAEPEEAVSLELAHPSDSIQSNERPFSVVVTGAPDSLEVVVGFGALPQDLHNRLREALESEIQRAGFRAYRLIMNGVEPATAANIV